MRVIKAGRERAKWNRVICRRRSCRTVFEFKEKDVWIHKWTGDFFEHRTLYISCPHCGRSNLVPESTPDPIWNRMDKRAPVLRDDT